MAVELFVGRWILFGLRQSMAISSAIAGRMSATGVRARSTRPPQRRPPRAPTFPMTISADDGDWMLHTRNLVNNRVFVYFLNQLAFPSVLVTICEPFHS